MQVYTAVIFMGAYTVILMRIAHVAVTAEDVSFLMGSCEGSRTGGIFGGTCFCPVDIMNEYDLTLAELTYCMEQKQPSSWTDPGQFCGDASENCVEPVCITLPR